MHETTVDTLRPSSWGEYVGQSRLKESLKHEMDACRISQTPLPHIFLAGLPGSGKTTLAHIIADYITDPLAELMMPVDEESLFSVVSTHCGILFLDEIHRAPKKTQEALLSLLEFGYLTNDAGRKVTNEWLTVIAATTKPMLVDPSLRYRFHLNPVIEPYRPD